MVDLFSHFPVIRQLSGENTKTLLKAIQKKIFADFGIPEVIISDNGLCYKSHEFKEFCNKFDINQVNGAAYNHQANAIAERCIQAVKHLMSKKPQ